MAYTVNPSPPPPGKPKPSFAPVYAALYPELAAFFREHGYALAVHGSMTRDFDLIAIPWVQKPSEPQTVVDAITSRWDIHHIGEVTHRGHGRMAWMLSVGFGECSIDLSFMPVVEGEE